MPRWYNPNNAGLGVNLGRNPWVAITPRVCPPLVWEQYDLLTRLVHHLGGQSGIIKTRILVLG